MIQFFFLWREIIAILLDEKKTPTEKSNALNALAMS